jgi:DNA-binding NtrC family response regulator
MFSDELPLAGKSVLVVEDEPLIAMNVEADLQDAGVAVVKIADSVAAARRAIDEGKFDAAVIDLRVADGDAGPLIQVPSERGTPVVVTTGESAHGELPDLSKAVAILQKPYPQGDLVKVVAWLVK